MNLDLRYLGRSEVRAAGAGQVMAFAPNLARPKVFFDGELKDPVRFREAMSALHDVVVGDLRFVKKDRSAYLAYKEEQEKLEADLRRRIASEVKSAELARLAGEPPPAGLEADFRRMHRLYWDARVKWAGELSRNDPELFRHLVPCDPVVTVAPDVVFFECFSKDESSYGCLSVDRDAFRGAGDAGLGTTNVDYSLALYDHFQRLRTYRSTRLLVDPTGFEVKVAGRDDYREEKIDLPASWLRGFGQLQAAMGLPCRRVELPVEVVYSILAYLARHKEKTGPRSLRFQLVPGRPPLVTLDPWGVEIPSRGAAYEAVEVAADGPHGYRTAPARVAAKPEEIKIWGRRRLFALARVLPLCDRVEVRLLGSGMPSLWIAYLGDMRMVLALSGWTANDWTGGASLELLAGGERADTRAADLCARHLRQARRASLDDLGAAVSTPREVLLPALHLLAKHGQVAYDFAAEAYRWREVMPFALADATLGPEPPEVSEGRRLARERSVSIERDEPVGGGRYLVVAKVERTSCEMIADEGGAISKAKCSCKHFFKNRLRTGPCRHLLALRLAWSASTRPAAAVAKRPPTPTRRETFYLSPAILDDLQRAAVRADKSPSAIALEAWDLAFERIQASKTWSDASALAGPGPAPGAPADRVAQPLALPGDVVDEIGRVAARLDRSPGSVVELAWLIARSSLGGSK